MSNYLAQTIRNAIITTDKKRTVLREDFALNEYVTPQKFAIKKYPFDHIVVDNFFNADVYQKLSSHFREVYSRGLSEIDDASRFHPFLDLKGKYQYDGYLYEPSPTENKALDIFFSVAWNLFLSNLFKKTTSYCTSFAYHYHPKGNKRGFIHNDLVERNFYTYDKLPNNVIFCPHKLKKSLPYVIKPELMQTEWRKIALLYYLNNDAWSEKHGGETGLYMSPDTEPAVRVAPKNNRLLAFLISERSFHAFQQNLQPRSCIVQWFHGR